jgi:ABC-type bacteriocin/lantibiotic exporter with double-glycine peptidase domain
MFLMLSLVLLVCGDQLQQPAKLVIHSPRSGLVDTQIHSQMLESLLRTKMVFFSKTRAGSIIQRFGQDLVGGSRLFTSRGKADGSE